MASLSAMLENVRADRLVAVLLLLQARGRVTAAEVAEELEVSVRTARRDLDALAMAGVPLYSQRGRGGGWSLVGGARTDLTGLTEAEARALMVAAGMGADGTDVLGGELAQALRKVVQAMPASFRTEAEVAARSVHVDPARWSGPDRPPEPEWLEPIQTAVIEGRQIELGYRSPRQAPTTRRVHPLGLVTKVSVWYLVGLTARGRRTYRLDRVTSVALTDEPVERPADFDLAEAWHDIKSEFGRQLTSTNVTGVATVAPWALVPLRAQWSTGVTVLDELADSRLVVEVSSAHLETLAYAFAGLGPTAEVHSPPALIEHLGAIGADLVERYRR